MLVLRLYWYKNYQFLKLVIWYNVGYEKSDTCNFASQKKLETDYFFDGIYIQCKQIQNKHNIIQIIIYTPSHFPKLENV